MTNLSWFKPYNVFKLLKTTFYTYNLLKLIK